MILGHIEQNTNGRVEGGSQVDLIGGNFDHIDAVAAQRCEREDRGSDIAANLGVAASDAQEMSGKRRGRRFAVGAGDGDEWDVGGLAPTLATEQFDIADHLDCCGSGQQDRPMRHGVGERHAGRKHQCGDFRPVHLPQISRRDTRTACLGDGVNIVVPTNDVGAALEQRTRACQSRAAQTENGDSLAGKGRYRDHAAMIDPIRRGSKIISASTSIIPPAPARLLQSRTGSRSAARSSRAARNDGESAPCGRRACR